MAFDGKQNEDFLYLEPFADFTDFRLLMSGIFVLEHEWKKVITQKKPPWKEKLARVKHLFSFPD